MPSRMRGAFGAGMPAQNIQWLFVDGRCSHHVFAAFLGGFQGVVDGVYFGLRFGGGGGFEGSVAPGGFGARVAF